MKVSFKQVGKVGGGLAMLAVLTWAVGSVFKDPHKTVYDIKNEIKTKDPKRYDSLINSKTAPFDYEDWDYERRLLEAELKTDSLVSRAYFEGMQAVRDSLKNANNQQEVGLN